MKFMHLHSTKGREPYGLFVLLVQLDFTIGGSKKWIIVKYFNALKYKKDGEITRHKILHKSEFGNVCYCSTTNNSKYYENILAN